MNWRQHWCHDLGHRHGRLPQLVWTWDPFLDERHLRKYEGLLCTHAPTYTYNNSKSLAFKHNRGHHKKQNYSRPERGFEACWSKANWLFWEILLAAFSISQDKNHDLIYDNDFIVFFKTISSISSSRVLETKFLREYIIWLTLANFKFFSSFS